MTFFKYLILLSFIFSNLKAQKYFTKANFHYLNSYSINGGVLANQASQDRYSFKPTKTLFINVNATILEVKNLNYSFGLGYRKKNMIGYGNYLWMKIFNNFNPMEIDPYRPYYNLSFNYINIDNQFKIIFLKKYKLNPFIFIGARFNKLSNYNDSKNYYDKYLRDKLNLRDNYFNVFYGFGSNFILNSNFDLQLLFEINNDNVPYRQAYFNKTSPEKLKDIRFLTHSIQIGLHYKLTPKIKQ